MLKSIDRRRFLQTGGLSLAGLGLSSDQPGWALTTPASEPRVAIAVATICLDGFGDENFQSVFSMIPQTAIKNVEFNVWYARTITPQGIEAIRTQCYQLGLRPISLQGSSFGAPVVKDVAHKLWLMEQAKRLGCRRVKFTGARRDTQGGLDAVIEVLKELAPAAEAMDVLIAVENHANNNIENIEDYDRIFSAIDSDYVGMCLDMGHFDGAGVDNFEVIERFHTRINHVDIKDVVAVGTYKSVPYGTGVTNGEGIVQKLLSKGYQGYLVIEQAPPMEGIDLVKEMNRIHQIFQPFEQ